MRTATLSLIVCLSSLAFSAGPRAIDKCGRLDGSGTYVLANDVSSPGTCFAVRADDVTIDLNQHTITYGSAPATPKTRVYGVLAQACWDKSSPPDPDLCGDSFHNLTVRNGAILQAPGASPYSHAIRVGQGPAKGLTVENLKITVASPSSVPIFTTYSSGGTRIHNVEIYDNVEKIANRHQIEGAAIRLAEVIRPIGPNQLSNIRVIGSAQGGLLDFGAGTIFSNNDIALTGVYTNDFGIYLWGNAQEAYGNRIHGQGRGIQIYHSANVKVHDNEINIFESPLNVEYNGCQLGGSFGIQLEEKSRHALVTHNNVTVVADACDARVHRQTDTPPENGHLSTGNHYKAVRMKGTDAKAIAASFSHATDALLDGDILEADTYNAEIDWDGGKNIILKNCRFIKGANAAPNYATFYLWPGSNDLVKSPTSAALTVIDGSFENGASPDSYKMYNIGYEDWATPAEYSIQWTIKVQVRDADGAVADAEVAITDQAGKPVAELKTDAGGTTSGAVLTQFRRYNTSKGIEKEVFHYSIRAQKNGHSASLPFDPKAAQTVTVTLR